MEQVSIDSLKNDVTNASIESADVTAELNTFNDSESELRITLQTVNTTLEETISTWQSLTEDINAFNSGVDDVNTTATGALH